MNEDAVTASDLLRRARQGDREALGRLLEQYRPDLQHLAERRLGGRVAVRVGASDIVQQTFLEAYRSFPQFLGAEEREWAAWLQVILEHNVAGAIRDHALLQKRTVRREQSLDQPARDDSGGKQELPAAQSSPSRNARRLEDALRVARAVGALPEDQQEAVRLRYIEGWDLPRIARHMNRTREATAGLIKRGLQKLRRQMPQQEE